MGKLNTGQFGFTAGEVSPKLFARVDLQRYQLGAKKLENVTPLVFGGLQKRFGTRKIAETKASGSGISRLVPYVINRDLAYMLEFGANYFRVFTRDGQLVRETPHVYAEAELWDLDYVQGADTMYLANGNHPTQRLRHFDGETWDIGTPRFTSEPFVEQGRYPYVGLQLDDAEVGDNRTVTADGPVFYESDVGRAIIVRAGIAVITNWQSSTVVHAQVRARFDSGTLIAGSWNLDASPMTSLALQGGTHQVGDTITFLLGTPGLRTDEIGQYIRVNGGLLRITISSPDGQNGAGTIITLPTSFSTAQSLAWTLESSVWGSVFGYPSTVSLHQQRLILAGSRKYPQTIWGSVTDDKNEFAGGTLDTDGFSFTIEADEVNPINFVASGKDLLALTYGGEFSLKGGVEKPITPTNVQIDPQSPIGSLRVRPVNVGKEIIFVQRAARKLRAIAYQYTIDGYVAPDLTVLAEHITESGIKDLAYQQEPAQIIWAVRNDGVLISCTIDRDQDVIAWARHTTDGFFESVATIPGRVGDDLWCIVRRTVGGVDHRFVERFESSWIPFEGSPKDWGYMLDCAVEFAVDTPQQTFTGLDHLELRVVRVIADGYSAGGFTVRNGSITLPNPAKRVLVGLFYGVRIEQLRPEVQTGSGTAQGAAMRTNDVTARFFETIGAELNGQPIPMREFGTDLLDAAPAVFSGDVDMLQLGWEDGDSPNVITQADPLPFHLLGLFKSITVNPR